MCVAGWASLYACCCALAPRHTGLGMPGRVFRSTPSARQQHISLSQHVPHPAPLPLPSRIMHCMHAVANSWGEWQWGFPTWPATCRRTAGPCVGDREKKSRLAPPGPSIGGRRRRHARCWLKARRVTPGLHTLTDHTRAQRVTETHTRTQPHTVVVPRSVRVVSAQHDCAHHQGRARHGRGRRRGGRARWLQGAVFDPPSGA